MARLPPNLAVTFDESDVRRLCGPTDYGRADTLQRAGHVQAASLVDGNTLQGRVRGTWRRVDEVAVTAASGRLAAQCTCGAEAGLCRHAGALLLQWLRDRTAFDVPRPTQQTALADIELMLQEIEATTPAEELAELLEVDTAPRLRALARRRGVALAARTKEEVVQQLAMALAEPASVDAALATLSPAEQVGLDVAHVAAGAGAGSATEAQIDAAYRAVAPTAGASPTAALYERGLLVLASRRSSLGESEGYAVPHAVAARLPTLAALVPTEATLAPEEAASEGTAGPGIGEAFLLVAHALSTSAITLREQQTVQPFGVPRAWEVYEVAAAERSTQPPRNTYGIAEVRLRPGPLPLTSADRTALARQVGLSSGALVFALDLLALLGILEGSDRLRVRADRLQALIDRPPAARLAMLVAAWLARNEWSDVAGVIGQSGALELRARTYYYGGEHLPFPGVDGVRGALAILLGRLPTDRWYDPASLIARLRPFQQAIGLDPPPPAAQQGIWFVRRDRPRERLDPTTAEGWTDVVAPLVTALLTGPLAWLGLVDVVSRANHLVAFRPRPSARVLARGTLPADALAAAPLAVAADLTVRVPPGADLSVHSLLSRVGEVAEASGRGLAYRLTAAGVRDAFDTGLSGPDLVAWLTEHAEGRLPVAARKTLAGWWAHYGTLRLYDEVTLIELGDDVLLRELQATTSLDRSLLYAFSPRVIAVDPAAADTLVAELTRLGHTPRVVEGA